MSKRSVAFAIILILATAVCHADPRFASLKLTSVPDSATVILDGEERGKTPLEVSAIEPGTYLLVVTRPGWQRYVRELTFVGGQRIVGKATLEPMAPADMDLYRELDSIRLASLTGTLEKIPDVHAADVPRTPPVLRRKASHGSSYGTTTVPAEARAWMMMLVADNGAVWYAGLLKKSGSLVLDDAAVETARHCLLSPALDSTGQPVPVWIIGVYSVREWRDSLALLPISQLAAMKKEDALKFLVKTDTLVMAEPDGTPSRSQPTGYFSAPRVISKIDPVYPAEAKAFCLEGEVSVMMLVDADGRVIRALVRRSSYYEEMDRAAVTAAKQWKFSPAMVHGGKPVSVWLTRTFVFKSDKVDSFLR